MKFIATFGVNSVNSKKYVELNNCQDSREANKLMQSRYGKDYSTVYEDDEPTQHMIRQYGLSSLDTLSGDGGAKMFVQPESTQGKLIQAPIQTGFRNPNRNYSDDSGIPDHCKVVNSASPTNDSTSFDGTLSSSMFKD